jgi:hypothetical protein
MTTKMLKYVILFLDMFGRETRYLITHDKKDVGYMRTES